MPGDSSRDRDRERHHRRDSSTNPHNTHRKKRSASSRDQTTNSTSTDRELSAAALAQLNTQNARTRRHSAGAHDATPSPRRDRERARERARERELERDREWEREVERERERMRGESGGEGRRRESRPGGEERTRGERRRESRVRGEAAPAAVAGGLSLGAVWEESRRADRTRRDDDDDKRRRESRQRRESAARRERVMASEDEYDYRRASSKPKREKGKYLGVAGDEDDEDDRMRRRRSEKAPEMRRRSGARVVSGAVLEEGRGKRDRRLRGGWGSSGYDDSVDKEKEGFDEEAAKKRKKKLWIMIGIGIVLAIILIIAIAVVVSKKNSGNDEDSGGGNEMESGGLSSIDPTSIPRDAPNWLNPFKWADTTGFNLTYTAQTVGDLPVMGLFSKWDDSKSANEHTPPLNKPWGDYAKRPARGVNVGGWLSLEPFITPSLFEYDRRMGIVDEYTLCAYLGSRCEGVLEKHYATFVTEDTFKDIAAAGLDHVRIPFSYWAVQTYDDDPYLFRTSWRYLLRSIEWCRKYGLRVNLDIHGLPGSQNGWNHSGRLGVIGWLNGTDGQRNAQRSLDVHDRLSKFFAQPRYKNIISHYGLANEPKMTELSVPAVLQWTENAHKIVRANGVKDAIIVFGDGFRGLTKWQGELQGLDNAALDVHQYVIFNTNQIVFNHSEKVRYACAGWTEQTVDSMNRGTGYGPTLVAEWSQADTDCARHLTNVGYGNRWTGTLNTGNPATDVLTPRCPLMDNRCDCGPANADASEWTPSYKKFLRMFAEAQMSSFEKGWGWFYWVWDTESAPQWSYKKGLAAGVLPAKAYERDFDCDAPIPSFSDLSEAF